jgi:predicted RNA binding protein YcfA (HicA-like mRNA interferase family)
MWSEEGVIKRLDANGWFQIEFMGSTNGWHVNQIVNISTD